MRNIDMILQNEKDNEVFRKIINEITRVEGVDYWTSDMVFELLKSVLKPLLALRDKELLIDPNILKNIKSYDDLKNAKKAVFDINLLMRYLDFQVIINLIYMLDRVYGNNDFKAVVDIKNVMIKRYGIDLASKTEPKYMDLDLEKRKYNEKALAPLVDVLERNFGNL